MMFRTIKVKLTGNTEPLIITATLYSKACQLALDYGFNNKIHNKKRINVGTLYANKKTNAAITIRTGTMRARSGRRDVKA